MQVDLMRDLALFDKDREELSFETLSCGCVWFQVFNHGVTRPHNPYTHVEKVKPCERHKAR